MPNPTPSSGPREVFILLGSIVALYISAISVITLLFQYVNYFFPDALGPNVTIDGLRWAIASLIIFFPAYILLERSINRDLVKYPARREGRLRKWLLYFTLFIAAITFLGDLVALIFNFLNAEFSVKFYLKVAAVALVSGAVFWYYLWNLRQTGKRSNAQGIRIFFFLVPVVVAVLVAGGFAIAGSPFQERLYRFDEQRVSDLMGIQEQVRTYWRFQGALPQSLDNLRYSLSGYMPPKDPENKTYEYRATGPLSFELCASFDAQSRPNTAIRVQPQMYPYPGNEYWDHGAGRTCFERTINPQLEGSTSTPAKPY